jgi:undecaprenyl-diphosphatase
VAIGYASAHPALAAPLLLVAWIAGASRVVLGVHFPADVIAGQVLAVLTAIAILPVF